MILSAVFLCRTGGLLLAMAHFGAPGPSAQLPCGAPRKLFGGEIDIRVVKGWRRRRSRLQRETNAMQMPWRYIIYTYVYYIHNICTINFCTHVPRVSCFYML